MAMAVQPYVGLDQQFNPNQMEGFILQLGDWFDIRVAWDGPAAAALLAALGAAGGGLLGGAAAGRLGAALGAGVGGAAGLAVSTISLREVWGRVKERLQELLYIVFNYLRRLDPVDYVNAFEILMASRVSRRELVYTVLDFIATKLGREVLSSIAAA